MIKTKITTRKDGYQVFTLNGKTTYVHMYLAEKYIPNPENKPCVNHKDGNKSNNDLSNLEWVTKRENCEHARLNGLSENKTQGIKDLTYDDIQLMFNKRRNGESYRMIAEFFKRDYRTVWDIINGKRYKDYGMQL